MTSNGGNEDTGRLAEAADSRVGAAGRRGVRGALAKLLRWPFRGIGNFITTLAGLGAGYALTLFVWGLFQGWVLYNADFPLWEDPEPLDVDARLEALPPRSGFDFTIEGFRHEGRHHRTSVWATTRTTDGDLIVVGVGSLVARFNALGELLWAQRYEGLRPSSAQKAVAAVADGEVIVALRFKTTQLLSSGPGRALLLRLDKQGEIVWSRSVGTSQAIWHLEPDGYGGVLGLLFSDKYQPSTRGGVFRLVRIDGAGRAYRDCRAIAKGKTPLRQGSLKAAFEEAQDLQRDLPYTAPTYTRSRFLQEVATSGPCRNSLSLRNFTDLKAVPVALVIVPSDGASPSGEGSSEPDLITIDPQD